MANINKALGTDLASIADLLRSKGRGKDTLLAHITPREAALLKKRGGSGTTNPDTGLPEFDDSFDIGFGADQYTPQVTQPEIQGQTFTPQQNADFGYTQPNQPQPFDPNAPVPQTVSGPVAAPYNPNGGIGGDVPVMANQGVFNNLYQNNKLPDSGSQTNYAAGTGVPTDVPKTPIETAKTDQSSWMDKAGKAITDPGMLSKLALAGGLGLFGASKARTAGNQINTATQQQQDLATPFQTQGNQLIAQAQAGNLNPQSQAVLAAQKAKLNQDQANRGGVGNQQSANQIATTYQALLDNQYKYGISLLQIGDNYALGAIKTGLQLDQTLNTATTNFYTNLASIIAGGNGTGGFGGGQTLKVVGSNG